MITKPLEIFKTKKDFEVEIWLPNIERLPALLEFINRLVREDTFLNLTGKPKTLLEEKHWLEVVLENIRYQKAYLLWAVFEDKIIASCDVNRGHTRDHHVGLVGLMVDKDYRQCGIGQKLLEMILVKAKSMGLRLVTVDVFSDNLPALKLYQKMGFQKCGQIPKGLIRQNKYSDKIIMFKNL